MEDGLRARKGKADKYPQRVLILVLVEDGLRGTESAAQEKAFLVLILVLVEDGLRAQIAGLIEDNVVLS